MNKKNNKLGQEPAFPSENVSDGMSKRFYAACILMQGMLTNMQFLKSNSEVAINNKLDADECLVKTAYSLADELLKQENL
jgi:hypothetical protein